MLTVGDIYSPEEQSYLNSDAKVKEMKGINEKYLSYNVCFLSLFTCISNTGHVQ